MTTQNKIPKDNPASRFGDKASPGRPKGATNKTTGLLKDAILIAATNIGNARDGNGLVSYLEDLATTNQAAFAQLVGKVLPLQITGDAENPIGVVFQTVYEAKKPVDSDE